MNKPNHNAEAKGNLEKLSRLRRIARCILDGPRAAMFPDDPKGLKLWLEPVIRMKSHSSAPKKSESLIIYSVPNCLERGPGDPFLIRHSVWESGNDKDIIFNNEGKEWPSIASAYNAIQEHELDAVDELLRQVDKSLSSYPYPVEGLDFFGASDFQPLAHDEIVFTNTVHNELCRTTRFWYTEIHWSPVQNKLSGLDQAWQLLFEKLITLTESSKTFGDVDLVEKYEIDPLVYAQFLNSSFNCP